MPEGIGGRGGEQRVEEVQSRKVEVSRASREGVKGAGDVDVDGKGLASLPNHPVTHLIQSMVRRRTHQMAPQSVHTTREAKRPYQAVSTTSRNILGSSVVSAPMKRTHHVEMPPQETPEAS